MAYTREDKERFLEILEKKSGNVKRACKAFGDLSRSTFRNWTVGVGALVDNAAEINAEAEWFKERVREIKEGLLDDTESAMRKGIKDGNTALIIWYLKTQGKERGYIERSELSGVDGGPIVWKEEKTYESPDENEDAE